jgi:hypothetical protein
VKVRRYVRYNMMCVSGECIFSDLVDACPALVRGKEHVVSPELPEVAGKHVCPTKGQVASTGSLI